MLTYVKIGQLTYRVHEEPGRRITPDARRDVIFRVAATNPRISYNHLLEIVCNKLDAMAKKTFERFVQDLEKEQVLYTLKIGNKKLYTIGIMHDSYQMVAILDNALNALQEVNESARNLAKFSKIKQNTVALHLLIAVRNIQGLISMYEHSKERLKIKAQKIRFEKLADAIFRLVGDQSEGVVFSMLRNDVSVGLSQVKEYLKKPDDEYLSQLREDLAL